MLNVQFLSIVPIQLPTYNDITSADTAALVDDFNLSLTTNVLGPTLTTNAFLPLLKKGTLKKIVTLASGLGDTQLTMQVGLSNQVSYCVSKAAVEMLNVKTARELFS